MWYTCGVSAAVNIAGRIEQELAERILRGHYPIGGRLPPLRSLAAEFGVNLATLQRALTRLEGTGLVHVRHGSGITVLDPVEAAELSVLPLWLRVLEDRPEQAASLLADFLEIRRLLAVRLLVRHRDQLIADAASLAGAAQALATADRGDVGALAAADLGFARALVRACGNVAGMGLLNTVGRVLDEVPDVARAMYADVSENIASMQRVIAALAGPPDVLAALAEDALESVDARTVARYRARLEARA